MPQEKKCTLSHPECEYHPRLKKHQQLLSNVNLEIAEQRFNPLNKSKMTTRFLTRMARLMFFKLLDDEMNDRFTIM